MNDVEKISSLEKKPKILIKKSPIDTPKVKNLEKFTLFFRLKSLIYLLKQDKKFKLTKYFIQRPLYHSFNLIKSYLKKKPYIKEEKDVYFFNLNNFNDLKKNINKNTLLVFGFSYCMKPKDCPKKRFSCICLHDPKNDHCKNCFIGKCQNAMNKEDICLVIPDVYYISDQLLKIKNMNLKKEIIFIIITCSLSINMFADLANTLKMKGLALELSGRVCVNYKSFLYAERGTKLSVTHLSDDNQQKILKLLQDTPRNL